MNDHEALTQKTNTDLKNAIYSQPDLVPVILRHIRAELQEKVDAATAQSLRKLYMTGCGDSYFAGVAAEYAFLRYAGLDAQAVEALNFSRYLADYAPDGSALVAVSNSGKVSRTIEAARQARERMVTWALTDAPESALAQASHQALLPHIPYVPSGGAGTRSYLASLLSLYALALHLGELRGVLTTSEVSELNSVLDETSVRIVKTLELCDYEVQNWVAHFDADKVFYVGGGPNFATAMYGAAKVMEALSLEGIAVELEEWAHLQFHTTFAGSQYILIAPPGAAYGRALEQAQGIQNSGGELAVVVDAAEETLASQAGAAFRVVTPPVAAFSPLTYCIPLQLLAVELAMHLNRSMVMRLDEQRKEINFRQIFHSQIQD
jgi:glucosamine--fructose-6-phosphate aminotransferase (isomerizing)